MKNALEEQAKAGNIIEDSIEFDVENSYISYFYSCGILGIEDLDTNDDSFSGAGDADSDTNSNMKVLEGNAGDAAEVIILTTADSNNDTCEPKYESYTKTLDSEWINACLNTQDSSMSYDSTWKMALPVYNVDPVLTQEQALEAFDGYCEANIERA